MPESAGLSSAIPAGAVTLVAIVAVGAFFWDYRARQKLRQKAISTITATIKKHSPSLVRRRAQLVRLDPYGKPKFEKWAQELEYFVNEHVMPQLSAQELSVLAKERIEIKSFIFMFVENETQENPAFQSFSDDMTPAEFETFCAEELRRAGWNARVTMQSRDQGVDVVADKIGIRVVLQCKLYARPVGNKSVQEAAAARAHEHCPR